MARTRRPFVEEVPRLLRERGMSVNALALASGVSQSHLSRVLRGANSKTVSGDLAGRVAATLGLPHDYFVEYRQAAVVERVTRDADYCDRLYDYLHPR